MPWQGSTWFEYAAPAIFMHAACAPGVYALRSEARCVYVGESENVQTALLRHYRGDTPWISDERPMQFAFEVIPGDARLLRRWELIREMKPVCNRLEPWPDTF